MAVGALGQVAHCAHEGQSSGKAGQGECVTRNPERLCAIPVTGYGLRITCYSNLIASAAAMRVMR